jgi:hypothetical protein
VHYKTKPHELEEETIVYLSWYSLNILNVRHSQSVAHNGHSFLLCWYSLFRQPWLSLNKVTLAEIKFFSFLPSSRVASMIKDGTN